MTGPNPPIEIIRKCEPPKSPHYTCVKQRHRPRRRTPPPLQSRAGLATQRKQRNHVTVRSHRCRFWLRLYVHPPKPFGSRTTQLKTGAEPGELGTNTAVLFLAPQCDEVLPPTDQITPFNTRKRHRFQIAKEVLSLRNAAQVTNTTRPECLSWNKRNKPVEVETGCSSVFLHPQRKESKSDRGRTCVFCALRALRTFIFAHFQHQLRRALRTQNVRHTGAV